MQVQVRTSNWIPQQSPLQARHTKPPVSGDCKRKQCAGLVAAVSVSIVAVVVATIILITSVVIVCKCHSKNKNHERHRTLSVESLDLDDKEERVSTFR